VLTTTLRPGSRLRSLASSQPETRVSASQLGEPFGKSETWVGTRTGIVQMRRLGPDERIASHAVHAARSALESSGVSTGQIDQVLLATCSALTGPWDRAQAIATEIGVQAPVVALNAACAGFSYALAAADSAIRIGDAEHVLIIAMEQMSRLLDAADLGTSIIFGDGAAAAVVSAHSEPQIGPAVSGSDGSLAHLIEIDENGFLRMSGREVFRWAVETVPGLIGEACDRAGVSVLDIDVFVPHQANRRITDSVVERAGFRDDIVISTDVTLSGNTSAASIPIALAKLRASGGMAAGSLALLVGFGAGLAYSAQVVCVP